jgi:hypothetical protein
MPVNEAEMQNGHQHHGMQLGMGADEIDFLWAATLQMTQRGSQLMWMTVGKIYG